MEPVTTSGPAVVRRPERRTFGSTRLRRPVTDTTATDRLRLVPAPAAPTGGSSGPELVAMGVRIDRVDVETALARVDELLRRPGCSHVAFVNAHSMNLSCGDPAYRRALRQADLVLNDGAGVALLGRALGTPFLANLNGTDFVPLVLGRCAPGRTVFLYGGRPGVAERAADRLRQDHPGLQIVGCLDGYSVDGARAADAVRRSDADIVLVALGNPRQELWVEQWGDRSGVSLAISVGAFFDFVAGEVARAPASVRALRLEWAFRLAVEPRRLARRYVAGIPLFLARIVTARWDRGTTPAPGATVLAYEYPPEVASGVW